MHWGGGASSMFDDEDGQAVLDAGLQEGERIGRFIILRDQDGCLHAVAAGAVGVLREVDDGTVVGLAGGKVLLVPRSMRTVLEWLDGRG